MFRVIGVVVTLAIIGLLFVMMQRQTDNAISGNAAVQEQKQVLQQATGIDMNDKKAVEGLARQRAKEIQEYQEQLKNIPSPE